MLQEFVEVGMFGVIILWEGAGNVLFVDSDMAVVAVALDGDRGPWDVGSLTSAGVSQVCA